MTPPARSPDTPMRTGWPTSQVCAGIAVTAFGLPAVGGTIAELAGETLPRTLIHLLIVSTAVSVVVFAQLRVSDHLGRTIRDAVHAEAEMSMATAAAGRQQLMALLRDETRNLRAVARDATDTEVHNTARVADALNLVATQLANMRQDVALLLARHRNDAAVDYPSEADARRRAIRENRRDATDETTRLAGHANKPGSEPADTASRTAGRIYRGTRRGEDGEREDDREDTIGWAVREATEAAAKVAVKVVEERRNGHQPEPPQQECGVAGSGEAAAYQAPGVVIQHPASAGSLKKAFELGRRAGLRSRVDGEVDSGA